MKRMKRRVAFLIVALFPVSLGADELTLEITTIGIRPDHVVLQAGDSVRFQSSTQSELTLSIIGEASLPEREHRLEAGSYRHRFDRPGSYEVLVKEIPGIRARAVVFSAAGESSDLRQEMVSYSIGYDLGQNVVKQLENLDLELFNAGIAHAYTGQEPKLSRAEMDFIVKEYGREIARRARDEREQIAARNREESRGFLELNARQSDVVVLPSGLQYRILRPGLGQKPRAGAKVKVHHRATFLDGSEFDDTFDSEPAEFVLSESVLPGYSEGLMLMSEGARWKLFVPPHLAYGIRGQPPRPGVPAIEPNATLVFEVELLAVGGGSHD